MAYLGFHFGGGGFKMFPEKWGYFPEKLPLPKNSITITETISNTRTKSQPFPEKSQPIVKNSQSLLKKSQPPTP